MVGLARAGYPQEKLAAGDVTVLSGLHARWESVSRARQGETRSILVPTVIHHLSAAESIPSDRIVEIVKRMPDEFSRPELLWRILKVCDSEEAARFCDAIMAGECDAILEESGYHVTSVMIRRVA